MTHDGKRRRGILALCAAALLSSLAILPTPHLAAATTYTVNVLTDTGAGSGTTGDLRYAVNQVNAGSGGDAITFAVTGTITLTQGTLTLMKDVTITGPGSTSLALDGGCTTCSASGPTPTDGATVITINQGITVTISGLTIQHGNGTAFCSLGGVNQCGGGIDNGGTLTVTNCTFTANYAKGYGAGLFNYITATVTDSTFTGNIQGGAIASWYPAGYPYYPHLTVNNTTITGNNIYGEFGSGSGGIFANGSVTVTNSTIANNLAASGGGIYLFDDNTTLTVTNTTVSGNTAEYCYYVLNLQLRCGGTGGGIYGTGTVTVTNSTFSQNSGVNGGVGGIVKGSGALTITNSTFSGNTGGLSNSGTAVITGTTFSGNNAGNSIGGGITNTGTMAVSNSTFSGNTGTGGGIQNTNAGTLTVTNSTIADNTGGGIYNKTQCPTPPTCPPATVNLTNTIVARNSGGDLVDLNLPTGFSGYFNLIDDGAKDAQNNPIYTDGVHGNIVGHPAMIGTLGNYGGLTQTILLYAGSPALDAGAPVGQGPSGNTVPATDQRGIARPQGSGVDIGAVEMTQPIALPAPQPTGPPAGNAPAPLPSPRAGGQSAPNGPASLPPSRPSGATSGTTNQPGNGTPAPAPAPRP